MVYIATMVTVLSGLQADVKVVGRSVVHVEVEAPKDHAHESFVLQSEALLQDAKNILLSRFTFALVPII